VKITSFLHQTLYFDTGRGGETTPNVKLKVTDVCKLEASANRPANTLGFLFPVALGAVPGIHSLTGAVTPGPGKSASFEFVEGIEHNSMIYKEGQGGIGIVSFCIEVGLYAGDILINYEEIKVTYEVNKATSIAIWAEYSVDTGTATTRRREATNRSPSPIKR
jgi:hypothetical protein